MQVLSKVALERADLRLDRPPAHHATAEAQRGNSSLREPGAAEIFSTLETDAFFDWEADLVDVSDIFYFFSAWGEGKGESGATVREGADRIFNENHRGGGVLPRRGGGAKGARRVSAGNLGGGLNFFFPYRSPSPRPHPDPTQHPETDPKRTRNGPERSRNGAETEPKWTEIKLFGVGRAGGLSG